MGCVHEEKETRIWGRKTKYEAVICKTCHLLLSIEELRGEKRGPRRGGSVKRSTPSNQSRLTTPK